MINNFPTTQQMKNDRSRQNLGICHLGKCHKSDSITTDITVAIYKYLTSIFSISVVVIVVLGLHLIDQQGNCNQKIQHYVDTMLSHDG